MDNDFNKSMKDKINNYSTYIDDFRTSTSVQGIWLFLATIGAWGVYQPIIRFIAMLMILVICFHLIQIHCKKIDNKSFINIENEFKTLIQDHLSGDELKARLWDLELASQKRKSNKNIIKKHQFSLRVISFSLRV